MNDEIKSQARELADRYKLHYLSDIFPVFMCPRAKNRYPQLHKMLYGIFKGKALSAAVMIDNMPPGSYDLHRHPNLTRYPNIIRYQYLRYIGRYGKAPPWKLVYQWVLKADKLRIGD